jgi:hypothetical protein
MDFTDPMVWTAQAKNGAVQKYTVVVSKTPDNSDDKMITNFFFKEHPNVPGNIDQTAGTITVTLPYEYSVNYTLTSIVTIIGKSVSIQGESDPPDSAHAFDFSDPQPSKTFNVYSEHEPAANPKTYTVTVTVALNTEAEITNFAIDGYPLRVATINQSTGTIGLMLPYGVSLKSLMPLIQYKGKTLAPASGVRQNFSGPVYYTVTSESGTAKTYKVTIENEGPNSDLGILHFWVRNVPNAKVVVGQNPRQDGKIPIVIQVPYGTNETTMIAGITLSNPLSEIHPISDLTGPADNEKIPFGNNGNP